MKTAEPIICRRWSGTLRSGMEEPYLDYFNETGARDYGSASGNLGYQLLYRKLNGDLTEVTTLSWWRSIEAIKEFSGPDYERARYYPEDEKYLISMPEHVEHRRVMVMSGSVAKA